MNDSYWKEKRVLVTGADGFMGSHLTERLVAYGARVVAFTRGTSTHGTSRTSFRNIHHIETELAGVIAGNLGLPETIQLIEDAAPAVIMHLGAEAYVPKSFTQPCEVFAVNANGTLHVLEAARRLKGLERIVCTSSSEVYGTADEDQPIDEDHPLRPTSPYAASKAAADRLAYSYRVTYDLPVAIIRPFNTYGPRHTYDVIPKFIRLALEGKPLTVHGDGSQSRDFTYVDDTVRGFLLMGSHPDAVGRVVNFGFGASFTIKHTAEEIVRLAGSTSEITYGEERPAEVANLICSNQRARALLGWNPEVSFVEGLTRNIAWEEQRRG